MDLLVRVDLALLGDGDFVEVEGEPAKPVSVYDPASGQIDVGPFGRSSGGSGAEQDHLLQVRITSEHGDEIAQRCVGQFDFFHDSPTSLFSNLSAQPAIQLVKAVEIPLLDLFDDRLEHIAVVHM